MILRLTVAFSGNPRVEPLKDSGVRPHGIDLNSLAIEPGTFFRNLPGLAVRSGLHTGESS